MIGPMQLPSTLAWLVDEAAGLASPDRFLAGLGIRLVADGVALAGAALTLAVPDPIIARRTWLWRAETGAVMEALGFAAMGVSTASSGGTAGRDWLAGLGPGPIQEDAAGTTADAPLLGWIGPRPFDPAEAAQLRQAARFAAAPLAALATRATLTALLEAYLGRRSAARVLAGPLRRGGGETIQAVLLYADLRGFTALSEASPPATVIAALDAWFDRIAGAVHAFGGEVLKFIGDGVLAIFPVSGAPAPPATPRCARSPPPAPAWRISTRRGWPRACRPCPSARRCIWARCCGAISAPPTGWTSPRSARRQSGQPAGRAVPAARPGRAGVRRGGGGGDDAAAGSGRTRAARHRRALPGLHPARGLTRPGEVRRRASLRTSRRSAARLRPNAAGRPARSYPPAVAPHPARRTHGGAAGPGPTVRSHGRSGGSCRAMGKPAVHEADLNKLDKIVYIQTREAALQACLLHAAARRRHFTVRPTCADGRP
jgi:hypothetical protein